MRFRPYVALTALLALLPVPLAAQTTTVESDKLRVIVAPYFTAPYMSGSITLGDMTADVSANPGDIFDKLQFGGMLLVDVRKGRWGGTVDGLYMDLEQTAEAQGVAATVTAKQGALDMSLYRTLVTGVDLLVGARMNVIENGLTIESLQVDESDSWTWVDPIVGVRLEAPTGNSRWLLWLRGDFGGFGIASDYAYQILPVVGFRASNLLSIHLAYRIIGGKYETGSGADTFVYDMTTYGPLLGLAFRF